MNKVYLQRLYQKECCEFRLMHLKNGNKYDYVVCSNSFINRNSFLYRSGNVVRCQTLYSECHLLLFTLPTWIRLLRCNVSFVTFVFSAVIRELTSASLSTVCMCIFPSTWSPKNKVQRCEIRKMRGPRVWWSSSYSSTWEICLHTVTDSVRKMIRCTV